MPAPVLLKLAKRAGESPEEAERLWAKAKRLASEEGHTDDYDYIVGIVKRMLGLDEDLIESAGLISECVSPEVAEKLVSEGMPSSVRQRLFSRYVAIEQQLRKLGGGGKIDWHIVTHALREAVMALLAWAASDALPESRGKLTGVV
jgi:hypothetical protein